MPTPKQISDLLAGSVVALLLSWWIIWAFSWWALVFLPWAVWEIYAVVAKKSSALITHAFMRLLRVPLVGPVLGVAAWYFFLDGQPKAAHRAALAVGLLVHLVFQNTIAYREVWSEADAETGKYGRVRLEGKTLRPGEPVYLLRGTDKTAPGTLMGQADLLVSMGRREMAAAVRHRAGEIVKWQRDQGPGIVKLPD